MRIALFGSVEVISGGVPVPLGGPKQRAVFGLLALNAGRVVPLDRLVADLWQDEPPDQAINAVQSYVSRLRRVLAGGADADPGVARILTKPPGWKLDVPEGSVDALKFEELVAESRGLISAGRPQEARVPLTEGLALWTGPLMGDLDLPQFAASERAQLELLRLDACELLLEAQLAAGETSSVVEDAHRFTELNPYRERGWMSLMVALYRSGRQAEALAAATRLRTVLADDLGLDPSPEIRSLEARILRQDSDLEAPGVFVPAAVLIPPRGSVGSLGSGGVEDRSMTSPLVGRDDVLAILDEVWIQSSQGRGRAVLLEGPAGIGKSAVLREFQEHVRSIGGACLRGVGSGGDAGVPAFWPWVQVVREAREHFPALAEHPSTAALALIDPALPPDRLALASEADLRVGRTRLYRAVIDLLAAARDECPLAVFIDDAHWLDVETAGLLAVAVPALVERGVLFCFGVRSDEVELGQDRTALLGATRRDAVVRLRLRALDTDEVGEVVRRISGTAPAYVVQAAISDRTGGNPLFVIELARMLVSERRLDVEGVGELLPPEVRSVLRRRIDRLPVNARTALVVLALVGRPVALDLLVQVSQLTGDAVLDACEAAALTGLLVEDDGGSGTFSLSHDLVRATLVESMSANRKIRWHARIAEALQGDGSPLPPERVLEVADHLTKAAALVGAGAAVPFLIAAADDALSRLALEQAERSLRDALVLIGQMPDAGARVAAEHQVRGRLAVIHVYSKGPVEDDGSGLELPVEEEHFALNPADPTSWWASMTLAVALGAYERMEREAHFALSSDLPPDVAAMVHLGMGLAQFQLGRTDAARQSLEHTQALIEGGAELGAVPSFSGGAVHVLLGMLAHFRGDEDAADERLARAETEAADSPPRQVVATFGAAWLAACRGDPHRCAQYADACAEVSAEMQFPAYVAMGQMLGGWARALSGAPAAVDAFDAAYARYISDGSRLNAPIFLALRAEAHAFSGDVETARRLVAEAEAISALTGERCLGPRLTALCERFAEPLQTPQTPTVDAVPSA
jgi:DNA-binding SARP family transcriptional activator/tetratricopeptide (TPR) repeat protein